MVNVLVAMTCFAGITLDLSKSLHNQGVVEQEHIALVHSPSAAEEERVQSPAKTQGATTHISESLTNSEVLN